MANWCFNLVTFQGDDDQINPIQDLFLNMQAQAILQERGQLPDFISDGTQYFFDIDMNEKVLTFCTKWSPLLETMQEIAERYGVGFTYHYTETANGIYGEAVFQDGILRDICLEIADFARYTYDDEKGLYLFEGETYADDGEILEILLARRKGEL